MITEKYLNELRDYYTEVPDIKPTREDSINELIANNSPTPIPNYILSNRLGGNLIYRLTNESDLEFPEGSDYVVNWDGLDIVAAYIPFGKWTGRELILLSCYGINFTYINPFITRRDLVRILMWRNMGCLVHPVDNTALLRVVDEIFKEKEAGKLRPIKSKKIRKISFRSSLKMKGKDRSIASLKINNEAKIEESRKKIRAAIDSWDFPFQGKITQDKLADVADMDKKTVQVYYKEYKPEVWELNLKFKLMN